MAEKGELLYMEDERKYTKDIISNKILFYFFIIFPIIPSIYFIYDYLINPTQLRVIILLLALINIPFFTFAIFIFFPEANRNKFTIYEKGFLKPKYILGQTEKFIEFENIKKITVEKMYKRMSRIWIITNNNKILGLDIDIYGETAINLILSINKNKVFPQKELSELKGRIDFKEIISKNNIKKGLKVYKDMMKK